MSAKTAPTPIPLDKVAPSLNLEPPTRYRHLCAQLIGGVVNGDKEVIARALEVREVLEQWAEYLILRTSVFESVSVVYELAGAEALGLALDCLPGGGSEHIPARDLDQPTWVQR